MGFELGTKAQRARAPGCNLPPAPDHAGKRELRHGGVHRRGRQREAGLVLLDRDCRIRAVNAAFARLCRTRARTIVNESLFTVGAGSWDIPELRRTCTRALASGRSFHGCCVERDLPRVGRKSLAISGVSLPEEPGQEPRLLLQVSEVFAGASASERSESEAPQDPVWRPGHGERDLRALNARLIAGQEELCKDVARELHDDCSQHLAAIALDLRAAIAHDESNRPEMRTDIEAIAERVRLAADALHLASRRLYPGILDDLGLVVALKAECHAIGTALRIPVRCTCEQLSERLDPDVALCMYRVAQEALKNVQRHACASVVKVLMERRDGQLLLAIEDDGVGFESELLRDQPCVGLTGMAERVGLLGGELEIRAAPGAGTKVLARVPLARRRRVDG